MKAILIICALGVPLVYTQLKEGVPDTNNIEGVWRCVSATVDGKPLSDATTQSLRLHLTKTGYKTEKGSEVLFDSTYTVDLTKSPKEINMVGTEGDLAGKTALGIFSYDGKTLRICYVMPGSPRPRTFESPQGAKAFLVSWRRER